MNFKEAKNYLMKNKACDKCIGRQFSKLQKGKNREKIGRAVRASESIEEIEKNMSINGEFVDSKNCPYCENIYEKVEGLAQKAFELAENYEFKTFLVGATIPNKLSLKEEELWSEIGGDYTEPLKKDLVRRVGMIIEKKLGKEVEFNKPEIMIKINFVKNKVSLQIQSLFVYGEYSKLVSGIPQTKWPCIKCRGKGCERCGFTGKMYPESVEELVAKELMDFTAGKEHKFHGSGREDVDAKMIGKRPFVIEVTKPVRRYFDYKEMQDKINDYGKGKIEIIGLRESNKDEVRLLKSAKYDKAYEAFIETEKDFSEEQLREIEKSFSGVTLKQRTPQRVAHRRADLIRERTIRRVVCEKVGNKKFKAIIEAESGTYIKELISGDDGRTVPSFTGVLGPSKCVELNVLEVRNGR